MYSILCLRCVMMTERRILGLDPRTNNEADWTINLDGPLTNHLEEVNRLPPSEFGRIIAGSARILSHCPNPADQTPRNVTLLGLGKIQSGKTASYTALISLAAQSGYRTIVVLAGTTNDILYQTQNRLRHDLGVFEDNCNSPIHLFPNPNENDIDNIRSVIENGHVALFVVLKQARRITNTIRVLDQVTIEHNPTLIIDDEGDQASLNTRATSPELEPSTINRKIQELRDRLPLHAFVAYTATPQANILLQNSDNLRPSAVELVEPGNEYCGGSIFFGDRMWDFLRLIPDEDATGTDGENIPPSLERALASFFVGAAIRHLTTNGSREKYSMLLHSSKLTYRHRELYTSVFRLLEVWKGRMRSSTDPAYPELTEMFRSAYDDFAGTFDQIPTWNDVLQAVVTQELHRVDIRMSNSLPESQSPNDRPYQWDTIIVIGGEKLGRGITIPGLAISYMTRIANINQADTLEQRARWFGYKRQYLGLCRVYLTEDLGEYFRTLLESEDDFWDTMRRNQRQGIPFNGWRPMLLLNSRGLRPTRPNVVRVRTFSPSGWEYQRRPTIRQDDANNNLQAVQTFIAQHSISDIRYGNIIHKIIRECHMNDLIDQLLMNVRSTGDNEWDMPYWIEYLWRLNQNGMLQNIDILYMASGVARKRTATDIEGAIQPFEGHTPEKSQDDPSYYPGDRDLHGGQAQFQIHIVDYHDYTTKEFVIRTVVFALYLPGDRPEYNLSYIIRDDHHDS